MLKRIVVGLILAVAIASGVAAGPFEDGVAVFNHGDYATAAKLWRPLAQRGNTMAQLRLGDIYLDGLGVPQDYAEMVKWYRLAAEQGSVDAQAVLGGAYVDGTGVSKNYILAHMWFNLAAAREEKPDLRSFYVSRRRELEKLMTPDQIAAAQQLAREWKPTATAGQ
jgi:TPR repeat protein